MPFAIVVVPLVDSAVITSGLVEAIAVNQVAPLSVLYCQLVRAEPPLSVSATAMVSDWLPRVTLGIVGCPGVVRGVPVIEPDAVPLPCTLMARTVTP